MTRPNSTRFMSALRFFRLNPHTAPVVTKVPLELGLARGEFGSERSCDLSQFDFSNSERSSHHQTLTPPSLIIHTISITSHRQNGRPRLPQVSINLLCPARHPFPAALPTLRCFRSNNQIRKPAEGGFSNNSSSHNLFASTRRDMD